ncbi:MAG: hypothetical protein PHF86_05435 [Candidatus Nanoarchaeia archaeon]|nr:hypothetical protein [Candidatus Nanoarchaeia archaeon]
MKNKVGSKATIVLLIISILLVGGYITGRAVFSERKVMLSDYILNQFNAEYNSNEQETVLCLIGDKTLEGWRITNTYKPTIMNTSLNSMEYESCGANSAYKNVIGFWHNHKNGLCELSDSDTFAFGGDYYKYGIELAIVQCDTNRMGIFTKDVINDEGYTFEQDSLKYEIAA